MNHLDHTTSGPAVGGAGEPTIEALRERVQRHVLVSGQQLRRIDELLAQARQDGADMPSLLLQIQAVRDRLVQELDRLQSERPAEAAAPEAAAKSVLGSVGLEFERALAAVFESPRR